MANSTRRQFSAEQILSIRDPRNNLKLRVLAEIYGVSVNTIWNIKQGLTYKELGAVAKSN